MKYIFRILVMPLVPIGFLVICIGWFAEKTLNHIHDAMCWWLKRLA
jgi:hypothetical protein